MKNLFSVLALIGALIPQRLAERERESRFPESFCPTDQTRVKQRCACRLMDKILGYEPRVYMALSKQMNAITHYLMGIVL